MTERIDPFEALEPYARLLLHRALGKDGVAPFTQPRHAGLVRALTHLLDEPSPLPLRAVDLRSEAVEAVVAELEGEGHVAAAVDLSDIGTHDALVTWARRELGELYVLAHLAAVLRRRSSIDDVTEEDWDLALGVNLKGYFAMIREAAPHLCGQGSGVIVNTSSGSGFGHPSAVAYAAAKEGVAARATFMIGFWTCRRPTSSIPETHRASPVHNPITPRRWATSRASSAVTEEEARRSG